MSLLPNKTKEAVAIAIVALTFTFVVGTKVAIMVTNPGLHDAVGEPNASVPGAAGSQSSKSSSTNPMNLYFDEQQSIETTKLAYLAAGCQVLTDDEADALFTVGLKNAYDGSRAGGRVPQSIELSLFKAKSEGTSSATTFGACDSLSNDPDQVALLHKQAQSAKAELAALGQTDNGVKN